MNECRRGCCWTPHQVCARQYQCRCHLSYAEWYKAQKGER